MSKRIKIVGICILFGSIFLLLFFRYYDRQRFSINSLGNILDFKYGFVPKNDSSSKHYVAEISFKEALRNFPWKSAANVPKREQQYLMNQLVRNLTWSIIQPPIADIDPSCQKPELHSPDCSRFPKVFTGKERMKKIGLAIEFGFESDVLEIQLREIYDVVDYIFIVESTYCHLDNLRKPLIWTLLALQPRFRPFLNKIVHIVVDDAINARLKNAGRWAAENLQTKQRWNMLKEWNSQEKFFAANDFIGFCHADEVAKRDILFLLKNCEVHPNIKLVNFETWFPWSRLDTAYGSRKKNKYVDTRPTFYRFSYALNESDAGHLPSHKSHFITNVLPGGAHLSDHPYAPFKFVKRLLVCTECTNLIKYKDNYYIDLIFNENWEELEKSLISSPKGHIKSGNLQPLQKAIQQNPYFGTKVVYTPYFLKCNERRYPGWFGGQFDPRLQAKR